MELPEKYTYKAEVTSVYDGDTITVNIDLGFGVSMMSQKIRLFGVNTPEIRNRNKKQKAEGLAIRDIVRDKIKGQEITLQTFKDSKGKFGRWLGNVYYIDSGSGELCCINQELINLGYKATY